MPKPRVNQEKLNNNLLQPGNFYTFYYKFVQNLNKIFAYFSR